MKVAFRAADLLLAVPERSTMLPGGTSESQSDVFTLIRHPAGLATYTSEGKVDEPFGPTVGEWSVAASPGKTKRLSYLCFLLGLDHCAADTRY